MTDLTSLRPADNSPAAINAALERCLIAGRGCLAEIQRLKQVRTALLLHGHANQLKANAVEMQRAMSDGAEIQELSEHLQAMLKQAAPEQIAELAIQQRAIEAAAAMATWWTTNAALVTDGLHKMGAAFAALGELQAAVAKTNAVAEAARSAASNVAPFQRPGA